jgi:hypothetical protein
MKYLNLENSTRMFFPKAYQKQYTSDEISVQVLFSFEGREGIISHELHQTVKLTIS